MYCICCKQDKVTPHDALLDGQLDERSEEDMLWREELRNGRWLTVDNDMVNGGIVQILHAGFGSAHDTDSFIIAICDSCIAENLEDATLLLFKSGHYNEPEKHVEESRKKYRRRKNLDRLV